MSLKCITVSVVQLYTVHVSHSCAFARDGSQFNAKLVSAYVCRCGAVYSLGPIAPFGCQLHTSAVLSLKRYCQDDPATLEWLREATGHGEIMLPLPQLLEKDMWRVSSMVVVQPHSLPGRVLALKVTQPLPNPMRSFVVKRLNLFSS